MHRSLATLLGYDALVLARIREGELRALEHMVEAWLLSCVLLSCPVGYALWLTEHSLVLALLGSAGTFALTLTWLRLSTAGGGASPHASAADVRNWQPAWGPTALMALLTLLLSQPAQLPLWRAQLDPIVQSRRGALLVEENLLAAQLDLPDARSYQQRIGSSEFVVLRLQAMWREDPLRAARLTFAYALLVLLPTLLGRLFWLPALRAYELERWQRTRLLIRRESRASARRVAAELRRWSR